MKNRGGSYVLIAEKNSIRTLTAAYSAIKVLIENVLIHKTRPHVAKIGDNFSESVYN